MGRGWRAPYLGPFFAIAEATRELSPGGPTAVLQLQDELDEPAGSSSRDSGSAPCSARSSTPKRCRRRSSPKRPETSSAPRRRDVISPRRPRPAALDATIVEARRCRTRAVALSIQPRRRGSTASCWPARRRRWCESGGDWDILARTAVWVTPDVRSSMSGPPSKVQSPRAAAGCLTTFRSGARPVPADSGCASMGCAARVAASPPDVRVARRRQQSSHPDDRQATRCPSPPHSAGPSSRA